jgi:hypothetical protein
LRAMPLIKSAIVVGLALSFGLSLSSCGTTARSSSTMTSTTQARAISVRGAEGDPLRKLSLSPAHLRKYGFLLTQGPAVARVYLSERAAARIEVFDFPSRVPPRIDPGFLVRYIPFNGSQRERAAVGWAFIVNAQIKGLALVVSTPSGSDWSLIVIDADSGNELLAIDGRSVIH